MSQRMQVYEALGRALGDLGVDTVFGLVGSGNFSLSLGLVEQGGVRFVQLQHEGSAISAADGWARATRRVGVATVTPGPGYTNALTALTEAAKSRTPLLFLAGDTPRARLDHNQAVDQPGIARAVGAGSQVLRSAALAVSDLELAYRRAERERRPIVLTLPVDIQESDFPVEYEPPRPPALLPSPRPAQGSVEAAVDLLAGARRPVIVAGRGAWLADAADALVEVGDRTGALLSTTAVGNGLFSGNPFDLGICGGFSRRLTAELIADADVVLAVGASLNKWTTRSGRLVGPSELIQCDVDGQAVEAIYPAAVSVIGDAWESAVAIRDELARRGVEEQEGYRTSEIWKRLAAYAPTDEIDDAEDHNDVIDPRVAMAMIDEMLPVRRVVGLDSGHFLGWPARFLRVVEPGAFVFTQAFQSIGLGIGSTLGAALAREDEISVLVTGDGGAMINLGELATIANRRLPMLVVIMNDAQYGAEVHHFGPMRGMDTSLAEYPEVDFADVASGMGFRAFTVRNRLQLEELRGHISELSEPVLIDCKIDRTVRADWLEEGFRWEP